jgi:hypothetical protein
VSQFIDCRHDVCRNKIVIDQAVLEDIEKDEIKSISDKLELNFKDFVYKCVCMGERERSGGNRV